MPLNPNIIAETKFYKREIPRFAVDEQYDTVYNVHNGDCLAFAKSQLDGGACKDHPYPIADAGMQEIWR